MNRTATKIKLAQDEARAEYFNMLVAQFIRPMYKILPRGRCPFPTRSVLAKIWWRN